jgi:hypothetical protein
VSKEGCCPSQFAGWYRPTQHHDSGVTLHKGMEMDTQIMQVG